MRTINISLPHIDQQSITDIWLRQFPDGKPVWQDWRFLFNHEGGESYDYLVAYEDLHKPITPKCPAENTIFIAAEPPTIHQYDYEYLAQFGSIITQDTHVSHPRAIFSQGALIWQLGLHHKAKNIIQLEVTTFTELQHLFDQPKTKLISVISSNKASNVEHAKRLLFVKKLKQYFGERLDLFGRGILPIDDKLEALQDYRFHVVLENSSVEHYFSEKLVDCIMAGSYPIYYGCPNLTDYFPENSFAKIDINNFSAAVETIERVMAGDYDRRYKEQLRQARDMAMYQYNIYPMLIKVITDIEAGKYGKAGNIARYGEYMLPYRHSSYKAKFNTKTKKLKRKIKKLLTCLNLYRNIKKLYLRYSCRKLAAIQQKSNRKDSLD